MLNNSIYFVCHLTVIDIKQIPLLLHFKYIYIFIELQQLLCLPSIIMLQSSLQVGDNSNCLTFCQGKAPMLKRSEPLINIQLDEIYVKPKLQYTADRIFGSAGNKEQTASRIQFLMISSITSKNKDVFSLTPVHNMSSVEPSKLMFKWSQYLHLQVHLRRNLKYKHRHALKDHHQLKRPQPVNKNEYRAFILKYVQVSVGSSKSLVYLLHPRLMLELNWTFKTIT